MTYTEVLQMLEETGMQVAYRFFPEDSDPRLPYIAYYYPNRDDFSADNINYVKVEALNIELYTENKDFTSEQMVESVLTAHGLFFQKTESYLDSEEMYEVLYETEVLIKGE